MKGERKMAKYQRKVEVVEAVRFKGLGKLQEVKDFMGDEYNKIRIKQLTGQISIPTGFGERVRLTPGDYIVKREDGLFEAYGSEDFRKSFVKYSQDKEEKDNAEK